MPVQEQEVKAGLVTFQTSQGLELRGNVLHLSRFAATFELYNPDALLRTSEVLTDFTLYAEERPVYSGRAVVRSTAPTGTATVCSVVLDEASFDFDFFASLGKPAELRGRFGSFLAEWQKVITVRPEFKVAISDIQTFLLDLRRWMEQVELGIRSAPSPDCGPQEKAVIDEISAQAIPVLDALFERFETVYLSLKREEFAAHRSYVQRLLHPLVLCAPFAFRSYRKPLGYAGDYEVVNMMLRDPREGSSLFAKVFNVWLLHQGSAAAHRNRIQLLKQRLVDTAARAARLGRKARILNLGCGPAREVQEFLAETDLARHAEFTLMDFNEETLRHVGQVLREKQEEYRRAISFELVKKSVQQLLKDSVRAEGLSRGGRYDFIYCAGLFDYLPDRTCKRLLGLFYQSLQPGGTVLITNVAPTLSPNRGSLELILDWHLIYRDAAQVRALSEGLPEEQIRIHGDAGTLINVFLEASKPDEALGQQKHSETHRDLADGI